MGLPAWRLHTPHHAAWLMVIQCCMAVYQFPGHYCFSGFLKRSQLTYIPSLAVWWFFSVKYYIFLSHLYPTSFIFSLTFNLLTSRIYSLSKFQKLFLFSACGAPTSLFAFHIHNKCKLYIIFGFGFITPKKCTLGHFCKILFGLLSMAL